MQRSQQTADGQKHPADGDSTSALSSWVNEELSLLSEGERNISNKARPTELTGLLRIQSFSFLLKLHFQRAAFRSPSSGGSHSESSAAGSGGLPACHFPQ